MNKNRKKGRGSILRQELEAAELKLTKLELEQRRLERDKRRTNGKTAKAKLQRLGKLQQTLLPEARRAVVSARWQAAQKLQPSR